MTPGELEVRKGIAHGNRCALCGRYHPGAHWADDSGLRFWEGWEVGDNDNRRYIPDMPENVCQCEGRDK